MATPLTRLADGTVLQVSPLTGTQVWTVPGRSHRPLEAAARPSHELAPGESERMCQFCPDRMLETPPEKARLVHDGAGHPHLMRGVTASELWETRAELRRFANLFEIVSMTSWRTNHGFTPPAESTEAARAYLADPAGLDHVRAVLSAREAAGGAIAPSTGDAEGLLEPTVDLLAGSHDLIVPRRHVVDGATRADELAFSGALGAREHHEFVAFTIDALADLYQRQPAARYVAVFQNWLKAAGASVDHLHKQLVAIDSYGPQAQREILMLREQPNLYQHEVIDLARREQLVVAATDGAVAVAGVGHRYPSLEIYSTSSHHLPWEHTSAEIGAMSELLRALHVATGGHVATNEEWHHRPPDVPEPMPWRIVLKWRLNVPAGFEGGTKIYVNTIDPWTMRERVVTELLELRASGALGNAAPIRIGPEVRDSDLHLNYAASAPSGKVGT